MGPLKVLLFCGLAAMLLLSQVNSSLVLLNYQINKEYIAKNLCENKDKPEMNCCGKCVVKKALEKDTQKNKMNFTKENEIAKFCSRKLKLNDTLLNVGRVIYKPLIENLPLITNDIATPPPKFYC